MLASDWLLGATILERTDQADKELFEGEISLPEHLSFLWEQYEPRYFWFEVEEPVERSFSRLLAFTSTRFHQLSSSGPF